MILKGSQRSGPRQLAAHLMNERDNDHVTVHELRGFASGSLDEAMTEAHAIAKGTRCRQPIFSLSLNPPKNADISVEGLVAAADRAEETLGLANQPRAIVIHEKDGRRHAHVVWSRIDASTMKAINLPHYKFRLNGLSKELYLEHGWELPNGHKKNGWKNPLNFTLAEWQQAKRADMDPREVRQLFQSVWERSDNFSALKNAFEEHGYYLAKGDRRGVVAVNLQGEIFALARWMGVNTKTLSAKIGSEPLEMVKEVRADLSERLDDYVRARLAEDKEQKRDALMPLAERLKGLIAKQRAERKDLQRKQEQRWKREATDRASRFRRGLGVVMDLLTGRLFAVRKQNEREAYEAFLRDRTQREHLIEMQAREREPLQTEFIKTRTTLRKAHMQLLRMAALRRREQKRRVGLERSPHENGRSLSR